MQKNTSPSLTPYFRSLLLGLRSYLSFEAWCALPDNFHKALSRKHLHFYLKAGIAAVLSDYMAQWAGLEHGLWAPMSALIVMQVQTAASLEASLMRLLGTVVGGGMGVLSFWIMHLTGCGIVPAVFFVGCVGSFLEVWDARFRLAGITAVLVLLLGGAQFDSTYTFAVDRVLEMGMGILSALLVSTVLWPMSIAQELDAAVHTQFSTAAALVEKLTQAFAQGQQALPPSILDPLMNEISSNATTFKKVRDYEDCFARLAFPHLELVMRSMERVRLYLVTMLDALQQPAVPSLALRLEPEANALTRSVVGALHYVAAPQGQGSASVLPEVASLRTRLVMLRTQGYFRLMHPAKVSQIMTFYYALCRLGEEAARMQMHTEHLLQREAQ